MVSGTEGGRRIQTVDDDRSDAWGSALILAAVIGTAGSVALTKPTASEPVDTVQWRCFLELAFW